MMKIFESKLLKPINEFNLRINKPITLNETECEEWIEKPFPNKQFTPLLSYDRIGIDLDIDDEVIFGNRFYIVDSVVYKDDHVIEVSLIEKFEYYNSGKTATAYNTEGSDGKPSTTTACNTEDSRAKLSTNRWS